jgi:hypothetical protein
VNVGLVVMLIAVGAAAIALWIDVRFPGIAPRNARGILIHAVLAVAAGQLLARVTLGFVTELESAVLTLVGVFGVAFPAIVYALLVGVWTIRNAQSFLGGGLHR